MAAASISSELKKLDRRRVSCETLCSSNSSCVLQKRKPLHPLASSIRSRASNNPVTQRVLSAKLLRFKTLQNQLNDANYHIAQLVNENKLLKNLQKRQDNALSKYEGANAQLPQVLESHQEEIRILQAKNKTLRKTLKEISDQVKLKDEELNYLKDQNKHLTSLCKNKNLEEREKLNEKVEELNDRLRQSESTISILNRKLLLESKNYKFRLNSEMTKHKHTQRELHRALLQIDDMNASLEGKDKTPDIKNRRKASSERQSHSMATLPSSTKKSLTDNKGQSPTVTSSSLTNLSEDVVSSCSSPLSKSQLTTVPEHNSNIEKHSCSSKSSSEPDVDSSSEAQIKEIVNSWQKKNSKLEDKLSEQLNNYSSEVISSAQYSNDIVDKHTEDYKQAIKETELIVETLKENDAKNDILNGLKLSGDKLSFYDYTIMSQKNANTQLMSQFLHNEKKNYSFEEDLLSESTTKSLNISDPEVDNDDKRKLLATLKAIDNGDNVVISDVKKNKCDLMKELFG